MNATITMDGLWDLIKPLSKRNKQWLAEKLNKDLSAPESKTEKEILDGIAQGLKEVKEGKTYPIDTLWERL